jgi:hypothetical protein
MPFGWIDVSRNSELALESITTEDDQPLLIEDGSDYLIEE